MFESFLVRENSLENVVVDGFVVGFKFDVRICDYRGCFLSLHNGYKIEVDSVDYPRELQKFEVNGKPPRSFDEIEKCVWEHWDFDDYGTVYVQKPGGLSKGKHTLGVWQNIFMQYGWRPTDQEYIDNPPGPEKMSSKQPRMYFYDMEVK